MARRGVTFLPGHYYHVYNRGVNREPIFRNTDNYYFLLNRVKKYTRKFQTAVIAYCLMPNHYHFLVRQEGDQPISDFIQAIFNSYTKAFNKAFSRSGTLFEGPFKAVLVAKDAYLIHLCRYIHRNPLEAGLVSDLAEWPFSNYLEWVGKRSGALIDLDFVRNQFNYPDEYAQFDLAYISPREIERAIRQLGLE